MRFLRLGVAIGSLSALSIAIACGIDDGGVIEEPVESGVQDQVVPTDTNQADTTPKDVVQPDTTPPPSCADAGSCLSEFDGSWTPYLRIVGNGACPAADGSVRADYLDLGKVTFDPNACVCGNCATDAGCTDPVVTVGQNNKCNDMFDGGKAPLDGSCADFGYNMSGANLSISATNQTAFAVCSVSQTGNQAWDAAVESLCSTSCDFDFCSAPKGAYERCALAQGVHACPNGYRRYLIDRPNAPANCSACTCDAGATCSGTLTMYNSIDCTSPATTTNVNGGCEDAGGTNIRSASFDASITTTCKPSASTPTLAPTNGELTICCK